MDKTRFVRREDTGMGLEVFNERALGVDKAGTIVEEHDGAPHDGKYHFTKGDGFFIATSAPKRENG